MGKLQTANVLPNGDITKGWLSTGSDHFEQINEITPITSDYITSTYWSPGYDRFTMQNAGYGPSVFTKINVKIYCKETVPTLRIWVTPYINGSPLVGKYINCPSSPEWKTVTWDNLEYDKNAMNTLEIQVSGSSSGKTSVIYIYSLYAELTYSIPWAPDEWTIPSLSLSGDFAYTNQSFLWYTSSMDAFKAKGGQYVYEVRRNIDVWDFIQPGFLCLYCFAEFATNLPDVWPFLNTNNEESDFWLKLCCLLLTGSDEEAELKGPISALQSNYWYTAQIKFFRRQKNQSFTLWTETEWCGGAPLTACNFGQSFEWFRMTTNTFQS